jgi:hypothetical protein
MHVESLRSARFRIIVRSKLYTKGHSPMPETLSIALKEWAAICLALIEGQQSLIVRKGGIAEASGDFQIEATRFLLYPTFVHQQAMGLCPEAKPLLDTAQKSQPRAGTVRLEAWAEVTGVYQVRDLVPALLIAHLHKYSDDTIEKRFHYRAPGLNVVALRVHRLATSVEIAEETDYFGCKSWVPLKNEVSLANSAPVLTDRQYRDVVEQLDTLLRPTAIV